MAPQLYHPLQRLPSPSWGLSAVVHVWFFMLDAVLIPWLTFRLFQLAGLASFFWSFKLYVYASLACFVLLRPPSPSRK